MPSTLSKTEICNLALDYLDEVPIQDFDTDTSARARFLRRNFWPVAWALTRRHPWNFALTRASLAANATAPIFGWTYAYDLPIDCLRVLPPTVDGTMNAQTIPFKVEGTQILTDQPAPLLVCYIRRIDNTGAFDQQFTDLLAVSLAQKIAHSITAKASYVQMLGQMAVAMMNEAQAMDALEGTPDSPEDTFWEDARQ